jgi:hypothetical protein
MAGGANRLRNPKDEVEDGKAYNETSDGRLEEARSTAFPSNWERGGGGGGFVSRGLRALSRTRAFNLICKPGIYQRHLINVITNEVQRGDYEEQA